MAEVYHVSVSGLDTNPGGEGAPLRTLARANQLAVNPGDRVLIHPDTVYNERIVPIASGLPGLDISWEGYGGRPIIDGTGIVGYLSGLFHVDSKNFIKGKGLYLTNSGYFGFLAQGISDHFTVENSYIEDCVGPAIHIGVDGVPGQVTNALVKNNEATRTNTNGQGEVISLLGVWGFEVVSNYVHNSIKEGIDLKRGCQDGICHLNVVHDTELGIYVDAYDKYQARIGVFRNFCHDNKSWEMAYGTEQGGTLEDVLNYCNILWNGGYGGFVIGAGGIKRRCSVFNNTYWRTAGTAMSVYEVAARMIDISIRNNIFAEPGNGVGLYFPEIAIGQVRNNLYHNAPTSEYGLDAVIGDPLFVDAPNGDFNLLPGSPAIGAGFDAPDNPTEDFAGKPYVVPIDIGALSISAAPLTYTLDLSSSVGGTTNPAPGSYNYNAGTIVAVTAVPSAGYSFKEWREDGIPISTVVTLNVAMDRDRSITAIFETIPVATYTLDIITTVGGTTSPSPGTYTHDANSVIPITALPLAGYRFVEWVENGLPIGTEQQINILMDTDRMITAVFEVIAIVTYTLDISASAGGSTSPAPGSYSYDDGTLVSITAIPSAGYKLLAWQEDGLTISFSNILDVIMDVDRSVAAIFELIPPTQFTLDILATPGGTTTPAPGAYPFDEGTLVTLTAMPVAGYQFIEWREGGVAISNQPSIDIVINADRIITAVFELIPLTQFALTISAGVGGITDPAPGAYTYDEGTIVPVLALPLAGYRFVEWVEGGHPIGSSTMIHIIMDADRSITAVFEEVIVPPGEFALTISALEGGTTNPAPGVYDIVEGEFVTVTAVPYDGYQFDNWEGDISGVVNPISFQMNAAMSIAAVFSAKPSGSSALAYAGIIIATLGVVASVLRKK